MTNSFCYPSIPNAFSGLEFDDQLEFGGLLDWNVGGFAPLRIRAR
jgi:hypothetical protein